MKLRKIIFCMVVALFAAVLSVGAIAQEPFGLNVKFNGSFRGADNKSYPPHDGLVTAETATVTDKFTTMGRTVTKIVPNLSYIGSEPIGIKHTSIANVKIDLSEVKYIRYYYLYKGSYRGRAALKLPASEFNLTEETTVYSLENVRGNTWTYLTFDVGSALVGDVFPGGTLNEMYLYPFDDTKVSTFSSTDYLYLENLGLYAENHETILEEIEIQRLVPKYPVSFVSGRPDVEGTAPETIYAMVDETIVLPENTFTREGYEFSGWICSVGSQIMQPGDEYTLQMRSRVGAGQTAEVDFIAHWTTTETESLADVMKVSYTDYCGGIVDKKKYGTLTRSAMFDGFETVKFIPDPDGANAATDNIALDGWTWNTMPLDISHYKYLIIPYYFKTEKTSLKCVPQLNMLGSVDDVSSCLSEKRTSFRDYGGFKVNQWDVMVFEFDFVNDPDLKKLVRWDTSTVLQQMHIFPFGALKANQLSETDELYLADFIFLSEIPETRPVFSKGLVAGDGSGLFKPSQVITNAAAASLLAKACGYVNATGFDESGYADVDSEQWCLPYVSFLESKGVLLPEDGEEFLPDSECTLDVFLKWITAAKSGGKSETADLGTIPPNPSANRELTRAYAVNLVSFILSGFDYSHADAVKYMKGMSVFEDLSENQWYYPAVSLAAVPTMSVKGSDGAKILDTYVTLEVPQKEYDKGVEYIETLDTLTQTRIDEIRETDSVYKQKPGGKTVYVSNKSGSGTVTNSSANNPVYVSSIAKISTFDLNPGDVVLLKRGETYRGYFRAKPGVTYSAYGTGDKPIIMVSPENGSGASKWTLDYEDKATGKKIWKYNNEKLTDVGGINLISTDGTHFVAYKEIPNYQNGTFFLRSDPTVEFDYKEQLDHDMEFVHLANRSAATGNVITGKLEYQYDNSPVGPLYLRCDKGNPGSLYPSIEFNANENAIKIQGNGITIDNLCIKYFGRHGISAVDVHNLAVTNCEIGWGGGSVQSYKDNGSVTRFGNGVEIYGALMNFTIDNCYVYEIYDAGITHQVSATSSGHYYMEDVYYTNNVLLNSIYNIEYFMAKNSGKGADGTVPLQERYMKNVYFTDNITRGAGYGWGAQRPDNAPSNVKGWTHHNLCHNQVYENNIFDRCIDLQDTGTDYVIMTGATYESSTPYMKNNIFVQVPGRTLMLYGSQTYSCDINSEALINKIGGEGNKVYFYPNDMELHKDKVFWR